MVSFPLIFESIYVIDSRGTLSKSWKLGNKKNRPQNQAILTIHRDSITNLFSPREQGRETWYIPSDG